MKIGYKATDKNMKCRGTQYEIGKEYLISHNGILVEVNTLQSGKPVKDEELRTCSNEVIHYCDNLMDCFRWYDDKDSRYFKVAVLGRYNEGIEKGGTVHLKFLSELTEQEISEGKTKREIEKLDIKLKLPKLRELQKAYPNLILGGSLSLYLQGAKLKRLENGGVNDFDLIHPYWINFSEVGANYIDEKNSGNTFDETYDYRGTKLDIVIDNTTKYSIVEFNGHKYKVNTIEQVLEYKVKYAQQKNGEKHRNDIRELLCIEK